jgi:hypothetical protein
MCPVLDCCEYGNQTLNPVKRGEIFDIISDSFSEERPYILDFVKQYPIIFIINKSDLDQ